MAIPKIIHYCWFGGNPLPDSAIKCIDSWKKYLPDYEIREWNESNFDINTISYTKEAYSIKKYAYVSDYARFLVLYNYGGLYFDTDVEIIKSLDEIIARGPFMGCEGEPAKGTESFGVTVAPGLGLGVPPGLGLLKELLDIYKKLHYLNEDGSIVELKTIVNYTTELLVQKGLCDKNEIQEVEGIFVYPKEYFCPKDYITGKLTITNHTVAIHHYGASWLPWEQTFELKFWRLLGLKPHRFAWHLDQWLQKYFNIVR